MRRHFEMELHVMGMARGRKPASQFEAQPKRTRNAGQKLADATEICVRTNLPQEKEISNALHILVNSEVPSGSSSTTYQLAISYIAVAWNISLLPTTQQPNAVRNLIASVPGLDDAKRRKAIEDVERLIAKKQDLFPNDRRTILSWDVRLQENHLHISAAAISPRRMKSTRCNRGAQEQILPGQDGLKSEAG